VCEEKYVLCAVGAGCRRKLITFQALFVVSLILLVAIVAVIIYKRWRLSLSQGMFSVWRHSLVNGIVYSVT